MRISHLLKVLCGFLSIYILLIGHAFADAEALKKYFSNFEKRGFEVSFNGFEEEATGGHVAEISITKPNDEKNFISLKEVHFDKLKLESDGSLSGVLFQVEKIDYQFEALKGYYKNYLIEAFTLPDLVDLIDFPDLSDLKNLATLKEEERLKALLPFMKNMLPYLENVFAYLSKMSFDKNSLNEFTLSYAQEGVEWSHSINNLLLSSLKDGVLKEMTFSSLILDGKDESGPIFNYSAGESVTNEFNLAALDHLINSKNYKDNKGDNVWKIVMRDGFSHDYGNKIPPIEFEAKKLTFNAVYVRQFDEPLGVILDRISSYVSEASSDKEEADSDKVKNEAVLGKEIAALLYHNYRSIKYDEFALDNLVFSAEGKTVFTTEKMDFGPFSYDEGLDYVRFQNANILIEKEDLDLKAGHLSFGDLKFPYYKDVLAFLDELSAKPEDIKGARAASILSPTLGFLEVKNLIVDKANARVFSIDDFALSLSDYIKPLPTDIKLVITNVDVPIGAIKGEGLEIFKSLGYEKIAVDGLIEMKWDEATQNVEILPSRVDIHELGEVKLQGSLGNVPRQVFETPKEAVGFLFATSLNKAEISYTDKSFADRFFNYEAEKKGTSAEAVKTQYGALVALPLAFLQNPEFSQKVQAIVQDFLKKPGTIKLLAAPKQPLPIVGLVGMFQSNPSRVVETLQLDVKAH